MKQIHKVYVLDDEQSGVDALTAALSASEAFRVCGSSNHPQDALDELVRLKPDLLFLDVEMPGMTGMEFLQRLRAFVTFPCKVVVYTAYDKYVLDALRAAAFDFLLKPFTQAELNEVLERFSNSDRTEDRLPNQIDALTKSLMATKSFMVPALKGVRVLKASEIYFFEYHRLMRSWFVYPEDGEALRLKREVTAEYLLEQLPTFIRVSPQVILNPEKLYCLEGRQCILKPPYRESVKITVSRECLKDLKDCYHVL
jgi:two-component system LytT family response regulator